MLKDSSQRAGRSTGTIRLLPLLGAATLCALLVPLATGAGDNDPLDRLPPANEGAFEPGDHDTPGINNVVQEAQQATGGSFDLPTGGFASHRFAAVPFSQKMLRFEEFGCDALPETYAPTGVPLPKPSSYEDCPDGAELDTFLATEMWPPCTRLSNDRDKNPWWREIEDFLGRALKTPPMEGRPAGNLWAHQRWDEFKPQIYYKTAQTGARRNNGLRDSQQAHGYAMGEFGPGGLYHNTTGLPGSEGTTAGIEIRFHPNMPIQDPSALWTFDGTLPPKLLRVKYGEPVLMRHYNCLPIDPSANRGFGLHTLSTHEHNGHNPAESDGYTNSYFFPGQYFDYRWPMVLAGHDSINTDASDPRAGSPDGNGGITNIPGDWHETMSTHWFHDHMLDYTAQNVYKGNAAMMNYYSAIDRGNERLDDGINLRLPSGSALDWGNRDYDVNLLVADKAWDQVGQLWFNIFNTNGFMGDALLANWLYQPYFEVRARKYRFRILNGSVSRYLKLALVDEFNNRVPFHMIANDGNIMEHSVYFDGTGGTERGILPEQGIAERYDIIVDFSQFTPGSRLYFVNLAEHKDGKTPNQYIPLEQVLSGAYLPVIKNSRWDKGDPCVSKFLEFRVMPYDGVDLSMDPFEYEEGGKTMIPLQRPTPSELASATRRHFEFGRSSGTDEKPWTIKTDGGAGHGMDPRRISAAPNRSGLSAGDTGHLEIWTIENGTGGGWSHPVHIHFEEGIVLSRDGGPPPVWERWARKDLYRIGPLGDSSRTVEIALRFREFAGSYMEHCHNTQHEDHAMLMRWDIENPGQVTLLPTPIPTWDGVEYVNSIALPTAGAGDAGLALTLDESDGGFGNTPEIWVDRAQLNANRARWRLNGRLPEAFQGETISVHVGSDLDGPLLGTAEVRKTGRFKFTVTDPDMTLDPTPAISIVSESGQQVLGAVLKVRD